MPQNLSFVGDRDGKAVILVVDDEPLVRNVVQLSLTRAGYRVLTASNGAEALDLSRSYPRTIDLVLSDVKMPKMPGTELVETLVKHRPGIRVVLMTGKESADIPAHLHPALIRKPFLPRQLLDRIRRELGGERERD